MNFEGGVKVRQLFEFYDLSQKLLFRKIRVERFDFESSPQIKTLLMRLGLLTVLGVFLTIAGPFGTYRSGETIQRFVYWFALSAVSVSIALCIQNVLRKCGREWHVLIRESIVILGTTILFTPFLWVWTFHRYPGPLNDPPTVFWMTSVVLAICISVSIFRHGISFFLKQAGVAETENPKVARLIRRLPESFSGRIIHLAIDGHIVQVITDVGTFDLRMRFSDAVDEVSEIKGACAHRSHWVALAGITEIITVKGRPCLVLSNGDKVPVSRKYETELEALGVL